MAKRKSAKSRKSGPSKKLPKTMARKALGFLHSGRANRHTKEIGEFKKGLASMGYNKVTIDEYWSEDDPQKLADNAKKLAGDDTLDLIIAAGGTASVYAVLDAQNKAGTSTNVVFTSFSQQIAPASNMTGVNAQTSGLDLARMQYLYELDRTQTTFGVLENQTRRDFDPGILQGWADQKTPAVELDRHSVYKNAGEADDDVVKRIEDAFADWKTKSIHYAQVCADPIFNDHRTEVTKAANDNKIIVIYQWKEFKGDGAKKGDKVFGTLLMQAYAQAGSMAGKVLNLLNPADIVGIPVVTLSPQPLSLKGKTGKGAGRERRT